MFNCNSQTSQELILNKYDIDSKFHDELVRGSANIFKVRILKFLLKKPEVLDMIKGNIGNYTAHLSMIRIVLNSLGMSNEL